MLFEQNKNLNKSIQNFYVEFDDKYIINKLTSCALICFDIEDIKKDTNTNPYEKSIMFKTHNFTKNEKNNLYKIEFWNHNEPIHLELLDKNYRMILHCPQAKNFYYVENNKKIRNEVNYFWYKNDLDLYGSIVFMNNKWVHAFQPTLNKNDLSSIDILNIWESSIKKYFSNFKIDHVNTINDINIDINSPDIEPLFKNIESIDNKGKKIVISTTTNDNCDYYIDNKTMKIYQCNKTSKKINIVYDEKHYFSLLKQSNLLV